MFARSTDPMFPFGELRREIGRLLEGFESRRPAFGGAGRFPAVNVWEDGEALYAEAELAGVNQEDLEILVVGNELTIKGRRAPREGQNLTYHRQERGFGEFSRAISLPVEIDADKVGATLHKGVLTLRLPKAAAARPRKITVSAG